MLGPVFGVGAAAAREVLGVFRVFGVFGVEAAPVVVVLVRDVEAVVVGLDVGLVVVKGSEDVACGNARGAAVAPLQRRPVRG